MLDTNLPLYHVFSHISGVGTLRFLYTFVSSMYFAQKKGRRKQSPLPHSLTITCLQNTLQYTAEMLLQLPTNSNHVDQTYYSCEMMFNLGKKQHQNCGCLMGKLVPTGGT